jgi:hypothetical protein
VERGAGLLAGIAKLVSPGLTTFETDRESGAKLVQKLDELELRLRNRGRDCSDSLRAALAGLEAEFRASPRMPAMVEPPRQKNAPESGSEGAANPTPSVAGEMVRRLPERLRMPAMTLTAILGARASIATAKPACSARKRGRELRSKPRFAI